MYDVIVVGAGPTGCMASKVLAEKGYRVLLVEKFKIPRYKCCSGVLIKKSMEFVKTYFGEDVPKSAICTPDKLWLPLPNRKVSHLVRTLN